MDQRKLCSLHLNSIAEINEIFMTEALQRAIFNSITVFNKRVSDSRVCIVVFDSDVAYDLFQN